MKDDQLYLIHIRECIGRIQQYAAGSRQDFLADTKTQDAVLRNLHTMAESTQRLSPALKAAHPDVDWRAIAGFRNVLVHDYLGVNLALVWEIIEQHLPALKRKVESILASLGKTQARTRSGAWQAAPPTGRSIMLIVHVHVHVKSECVEAFMAASLENARNSVKEPGIARFDVRQQSDDPTRFVLVEVYRSVEATAAHKETAHYAKWRDTVAGMMAEPRKSVKYDNVFPDDSGW